MAITDYQNTETGNRVPNSNGYDPLWPENMPHNLVNNAARQVQADVRSAFETLPWFNWDNGQYTPSYVSPTQFTIPGNVTSIFEPGRPVRDPVSGSIGTISISSFGVPDTTVQVVWSSGAGLQTSGFTIELCILDVDAINEIFGGSASDIGDVVALQAKAGPFVGDLKHSLQAVDHGGWYKADGRLISSLGLDSDIEADAIAVYGTNLPDERDRFLVGAGPSYAPGTTGGEAESILTADNHAPHTHDIDLETTAAFTLDDSGAAAVVVPATNIATTSSQGVAEPFSNLPPYRARNIFCWIG